MCERNMRGLAHHMRSRLQHVEIGELLAQLSRGGLVLGEQTLTLALAGAFAYLDRLLLGRCGHGTRVHTVLLLFLLVCVDNNQSLTQIAVSSLLLACSNVSRKPFSSLSCDWLI